MEANVKVVPSDDFNVLVGISGANGALAEMAQTCKAVNDGLTRIMDATEGPDATDTLDASCNTCKHFGRISFDRETRPTSIWGFPGTCAKTGAEVVGWPRGQYCGHSCYENRRTGKSGPEQDFHIPNRTLK